MATSGFGPFSLIEHTGRTSGRVYRTPVILAGVPQGFVAELSYGDQVDWYRNVIAAGGCTVLHRRQEYQIDSIRECDPQRGREAFPVPARTVLRLLRRNEFRVLQTEGAPRE
jgi:Domain of unknown function (DUF385).